MTEPNTERCSYINCGKQRLGQQFHYLPLKNSSLCVKWLINSGREDLLTRETPALESLKLAICSNHFHDDDYLLGGALKEDAVPIQYWDLGYSTEIGGMKNAHQIDQQTQNDSIESLSTTGSETDSNLGSDNEFRTQLGNKIEAVLNSVQNFHGQSASTENLDFEHSVQNLCTKLKLNSVGYNDDRNHLTSTSDLMKLKRTIKNMCRTCARKKNNLVNIVDETTRSSNSILTKLKLLIEIKNSDDLPKKICHECLAKLEQSYKFFQQIYKADSTLRGMLFKCKQESESLSNRHNKCNGDVACSRNPKTSDKLVSKAQKFRLKVNNLSLKNNLNTTWMDSEVAKFDEIMKNNDNILEKISLNSEIYSSENTENTVSYLLSDCSNNDAALNWLDVVGTIKKEHKPNASKSNTVVEKSPVAAFRIQCKHCDRTFKLRRQLKTHIAMNHSSPINYTCEHCSVSCTSEKSLSEHYVQAHPGQRYNSNNCDSTVSKKDELLSHIEQFDSRKSIIPEKNSYTNPHLDQTFACDDCEKTFSCKQTLCKHIHRLHPPFAYTCTICNNVMYSEAATYKHMTTHDKAPLFPCHDCGRMFYSTKKLEKHKSIHDSDTWNKRKRVWFHCQLCDASYTIAEELIKHIESHSSEDWEKYRTKILYCGECNARLIGKEKFRIHKMKYHLSKRGDFICLLCDGVTQDFQSFVEYEKHIKSHSNELQHLLLKNFKCEHCRKAFNSNSSRINHIDLYHSDVMHSCPICNLKIKREDHLRNHITTVHNSNRQSSRKAQNFLEEKCSSSKNQRSDHNEEDQEPFKNLEKLFPWAQRYSCDHCSMKFYYMHKLRQHLLSEHGDKENAAIIQTLEKYRKFKCTECEATFKHKSGLDTHMKRIHSDTEHTCYICGLKLKLARDLCDHLLTHDKDMQLHKCQYCEKQFEHEKDKINHEDNHHAKRFKSDSFDCDSE
ncbi:PR domain zinc finger protein 5-like isoform X1 [Neodiprion fabricii]|uniref:PR domain zinc finger protein 5-like isoform X1 n=1 Tax=Neodiprion fabricii TaxID=2872261 RepID=UPI001ED917AD|nr:PR domain zinc finger protein 5-like isoform X1 [Neodiprion fabricii]XP_046409818.1 PR domain zinc finger protein 5-like isoform X1 [Neodiprion fabricii]